MRKIKQLPSSVVNKIAAGEVIERPASVLKELLENAVDAGASRIDVSITQGGSEMIRVADNGCGVAADQLPPALDSHATSKIHDADDLFRITTLGFRGEALASIAQVSQLRLRSRTSEAEAGAELQVNGGQRRDVTPCAGSVGTVVEVRELFYNTPVRRKFLRSTQTEMGHCSEAVTRLALAQPHVHVTLRHNERSILDLAPVESWRTRIAALVGDELGESLIWVESTDDQTRLTGYVADPSQSRTNNRMQYLFINGRYIRDRSMQHALREAYRGLLTTGRYAIAFLRIEMLPEMVDVNVHPTKLEVRFQDGGRLYSHLLGTLRTRFLTMDLTCKIRPAGSPPEAEPATAHDERQTAKVQTEFVRWARGQLADAGDPSQSASVPEGSDAYGRRGEDDWQEGPHPENEPPGGGKSLELTRLDRSWRPGDDGKPTGNRPPRTAEPAGPTRAADSVSAIQVHNRYLITESEEGVVVIDQHALHERILYEELREKVLDGKLEAQQLLVPEAVHLAAAETAAVLDAQNLLSQLAVAVEPFGGDTVLVSSYPAMLANMNPAEVLHRIADELLLGDRPPDRRDLLDGLLHMISCKAAIKAGDHLTAEEIAALLQKRHFTQDSHHCPHGRPTALVFTHKELDRKFKRI